MPMDMYAEKGTKIIFSHPNAGYSSDQELAAKHLVVGNVYTVEYTEVFSWSSDVYLVEIPDVAFNTVHFDEVEK